MPNNLYTSKDLCKKYNISMDTLGQFNTYVSGTLIKLGGYKDSACFYSKKQVDELEFWLQKKNCSCLSTSPEGFQVKEPYMNSSEDPDITKYFWGTLADNMDSSGKDQLLSTLLN